MTARDREKLKMEIIKVFTQLYKLKEKGIWFGEPYNSEYISWYKNGQKYEHSIARKDWKGSGICGEYKSWFEDGELMEWSFFKFSGSIVHLENPFNLEFAHKNDQGLPWFKIDL